MGNACDNTNNNNNINNNINDTTHNNTDININNNINNNNYNNNESYLTKANYSETEFHYIEFNNFTLPILGYATPVFVVFTIITNCLVCAVLLKKPMRSSTNTVLFSLAISDSTTGLLPLPCFLYFYTFNKTPDYIPYSWCLAFYTLTDYLPTAFHTTSIWLTTILACQRYVYVCRSAVARRGCTQKRTVKMIVLAYVVALLMQMSHYFEGRFVPVEKSSKFLENSTILTCVFHLNEFVEDNVQVYFGFLLWFRLLFVHFLPCLVLVLLNAALIRAIRRAQAKRRKLFLSRQRRNVDCKNCRFHSQTTTRMLIVVVGIFLLVELPLAIFIIVNFVENTWEYYILSRNARENTALLVNLAIIISYPCNFFVYCAMSQQFRRNFCELFSLGRRAFESETTTTMMVAVARKSANNRASGARNPTTFELCTLTNNNDEDNNNNNKNDNNNNDQNNNNNNDSNANKDILVNVYNDVENDCEINDLRREENNFESTTRNINNIKNNNNEINDNIKNINNDDSSNINNNINNNNSINKSSFDLELEMRRKRQKYVWSGGWRRLRHASDVTIVTKKHK
ncbi:hypothetical protein HELRODRAFT_81990 [Helobdella robusta]|uniref:G-protein coupled receptors family 1 profile domain-containing protein n=1 Tax=Helobdella robusta TaxID=6412 RepID=T1G4L4_HELRO|nr:hypothetical protein HELRODRAFT_81990 [Helobdella robusta]ESO01228.1 hypothetical protein HELRODRAFT_81990 [Helobdella robusta]